MTNSPRCLLGAIACASVAVSLFFVPSDFASQKPDLGSAQPFDWPQWRGPERNGKSRETGFLRAWPKDGPRLVWKASGAGRGYSGPSVSRGRLLTMGNLGTGREEREYVLCYDATTGQQLWRVVNGPAYHNSYGDGPRCTPTIDGDLVYALGAQGELACLRLSDGSTVWRKNILKEYDSYNIGWGISESPLVVGDWLIVTPGGNKATMVALDKRTGQTVWTSKDPAMQGREPPGYASPILFRVGNTEQLATFTGRGAYACRLRDGQFLWRYDKVANSTANIATPVFHENSIFYSSDYGTGCALLRLTPDGRAEEVYFNKNFKNHHGGFVLVDGYIYGYDSSVLTCLRWNTGQVMWKDRSVGKGSLVYADGLLFVLSETGVVALVEATPKHYRELARFKLPQRSDRPSWPHPILANGHLFIRDQDTIFCFAVK
ncbi:MAG: PQQ-like beta-propeller repeat protein [Gemmatales bacterium]|nr:PQQ-like beta-propeller repeat protein [Gemmatales bacterium]MDW8223761.1 PQQ-binding-like beta-propeller repeat protein [Gemmatales bacterium]